MVWRYPILPEQLAKAQSERRFDADWEWLALVSGHSGQAATAAAAASCPPSKTEHNGLSEGVWTRQRVVHRRPLDPPSLTWAEGGTFVQLKLPCDLNIERTGKREAISGFSLKSQRNLLNKLNSLNCGEIKADRTALATLTYPDEFVPPRVAKSHLKALFRKLQAQFGRVPLLWKLEPQRRGAPHFHLLIFAESSPALDLIKSWIPLAWYEIAGKGDVNHLRWHLGQLGSGNRHCVERINGWNGVRAYAAKYCAKPILPGDERLAGWEWPGRFWGWRFYEDLPRRVRTWDLTQARAKLAKRLLRAWYEKQPSGVYLLTRPDDPQLVKRLRLTGAARAYYRTEGYHLFPIPRKWKGGRGGMTVYAPERFSLDLCRYLDMVAPGQTGPPASSSCSNEHDKPRKHNE